MKKTQQQRSLDWWNDLSVDRKVNLCNNHSKSVNDITVQEILEIFHSTNSLPQYKDPPPPPVAVESKEVKRVDMDESTLPEPTMQNIVNNKIPQNTQPTKPKPRQGTYFNGDGDNAVPFTQEEVKAAKATRDQIIRDDIKTLKAIYMAGEICMWDELRHDKNQNEAECQNQC